jgi:hypothetical protein
MHMFHNQRPMYLIPLQSILGNVTTGVYTTLVIFEHKQTDDDPVILEARSGLWLKKTGNICFVVT